MSSNSNISGAMLAVALSSLVDHRIDPNLFRDYTSSIGNASKGIAGTKKTNKVKNSKERKAMQKKSRKRNRK